MVKVKEQTHLLADGTVDLDSWLEHLAEKHAYIHLDLVRHACTLAQLTGSEKTTFTGQTCFQSGLAMAEILMDLEVDPETLAAAIIYDTVHYADLPLEEVETQLGKPVARLVLGVKRMSAMHHQHALKEAGAIHQHMDNVRKMLLAMVDDVRGVLIKLAEQLHQLRMASALSESMRKEIAQEVMDIYAPLANRLGVGTIKWEMEDRAFRHLKPDEYKTIADGLRTRRLDRDQYVHQIVAALDDAIKKMDLLHYRIYGRSKHIHSIYRKMTQKNRALSEIYDATAVRILVDTEQDCYTVLSLVHTLWTPIASEFDDYIAHPKANGYRSLHTAVIGPQEKHFEVQIRTYEMHDLAELGVAAHWKYKEGTTTVKETHERKIEWLREVLAWHHEVAKAEGGAIENQSQFLEERVYVFTPMGQIIDLPVGSTPLDFAYHVHSDIGHRCRGAKVNDHMVTLKYHLKMGDRIEILTSKQPHPSRDWINAHLGYLKSSRARAKVLLWFREQDALNNVNHALPKALSEPSPMLIKTRILPSKKVKEPKNTHPDVLYIEGVDHLLTRMANCCKPLIDDAIVGYVTVGRGISIHKQSCANIIKKDKNKENRLVQVKWEK